jgi:endonuclease/exonuclease/phosphatase family metal-dependent hydrolase
MALANQSASGPPLVSPTAPVAQTKSAELSVLTYNIRGLPWPIALGRDAALKRIGAELALMRREGRQPDIVLLQEGFRGEVEDLVAASGYRYHARGPGRGDRAGAERPEDGRGFRSIRYPFAGEGWGKFTGGGLHVLSDLPIAYVRSTAYRYCAGLDCLANKGAMLVRVTLPGTSVDIDVVNTHMNSKRAAKVPIARSLRAHNLQTEQLIDFINDQRDTATPLLVGGDFNVKGAPDRYGFMAPKRPYKVVSEFCETAACEGQAKADDAQPWLRSQDLQAFSSAPAVQVTPTKVETLFARGQAKPALSDHDGYLVQYQISWNPAEVDQARRSFEMKPTLHKKVGVKVAWRP